MWPCVCVLCYWVWWWSLLLKSLVNTHFLIRLVILIISSKYSYHENLQTGWPYLPIFVNGYINKDCSIKYLYLYKVNWYMIKWFYTFSIYKKVTECMLNVFLIPALFILSSGQVSDSCWCSPPAAPCSTAPAGLAGTWTWLSPRTSFPPLSSELGDKYHC